MKKSKLLLISALACFSGHGYAQRANVLPCYADEMRQQQLIKHPELKDIEANYEAQIKEGLKHIDFSKLTRRTADSTGVFWYDIPIVVHVIHDYGLEYTQMTDEDIYNDVAGWNIVYAKENSDTADVIPTYAGNITNTPVRYMGNPHIRLHLATIDPNGNPTHGITRHRSYLTYTGNDYAKLDDWNPQSYVNIWSINNIPVSGGFSAAAYAYQPPAASANPYYDGVICLYDYMPNSPYGSATASSVGKTINHEVGHVMNLMHPWGNTNFPQVAIGDDDVDDTPPTWGHLESGCDYSLPNSNVNSLYDTFGATNYYVIYTNIAGTDSLVNYPDTTNTQNIMDYTYCSRMFTNGQVARMQAALNNSLAGRSNLWSDTNLMHTGVMNADLSFTSFPDLKPIPAFNATITGGTLDSATYESRLNYFTIPGINIKFVNETWNDTLTSLTWTFSNGALIPSQTVTTNIPNSSLTNNFQQGGWVTVTMTAQGNNSGDTTVTWNNAIFVADSVATPAPGYVQTFNPATSSDVASWPFFNYYNNEFQWEVNSNIGYGDNYCMEYIGYDSREIPLFNVYPTTGNPSGDVDDLFSVPFNLSNYDGGACYLNYMFTGACRSANSLNCNDALEIDYMTKTGAWVNMAVVTRNHLDNMGAVDTSYVPTSMNNWTEGGVQIPTAAITPYTVFRFRYLPGNGLDGFSSGNNFYMDDVHISEWPASVESIKPTATDVVVFPNPTSGNAFVTISDANNTQAQVMVSDITGKEVYNATRQIVGNIARVEIPASAITAKGIYMIQVITGNQNTTKKLVVY